MKVKINNKALAKTLNLKLDDTVDVECKNGVPINREWRNRIKDAKIDKCVIIIKDTKIKGDK